MRKTYKALLHYTIVSTVIYKDVRRFVSFLVLNWNLQIKGTNMEISKALMMRNPRNNTIFELVPEEMVISNILMGSNDKEKKHDYSVVMFLNLLLTSVWKKFIAYNRPTSCKDNTCIVLKAIEIVQI